jgi:hypothetical protein
MLVLLLLRGDAFRDGRSAPIAGIEQPMQLETFESAKKFIVNVLESQGHTVKVCVDICAHDQVDVLEKAIRNCFKERIVGIRISSERGENQRESLLAMFKRQYKTIVDYDMLVMTRCDMMWTKSPCPDNIRDKQSIRVLCRIPKRDRLLNDSIFFVPKKRVKEFVDFFQTHYHVSIHSMDKMIPDIHVITKELYGCNTEKYYNPYYYIVGRPRTMVNLLSVEMANPNSTILLNNGDVV